MRFSDILIIGAMKSGTTSLSADLVRHFTGLLTYRYVSRFCRQTRALRDIMSWEELVNYEYYDADTARLVHEREQMIVDKFENSPPGT